MKIHESRHPEDVWYCTIKHFPKKKQYEIDLTPGTQDQKKFYGTFVITISILNSKKFSLGKILSSFRCTESSHEKLDEPHADV